MYIFGIHSSGPGQSYEGRYIGPYTEKSGYTDVKEPRISPLDIQTEAENSVYSGHDDE
jgi:hypothetical protein